MWNIYWIEQHFYRSIYLRDISKNYQRTYRFIDAILHFSRSTNDRSGRDIHAYWTTVLSFQQNQPILFIYFPDWNGISSGQIVDFPICSETRYSLLLCDVKIRWTVRSCIIVDLQTAVPIINQIRDQIVCRKLGTEFGQFFVKR